MASSPKIFLNDKRLFEMVGFSNDVAPQGVSLTAQFELTDELIELLQLNATSLEFEVTQPGRPSSLRSVMVRGTVGFDQRLHLLITPAPATETVQWAGTLSAPQLVRRIARPGADEAASSAAAMSSGMDASLPIK